MDKEAILDLIEELTKAEEPLEVKRARWEYYLRGIKWTGFFASLYGGMWVIQYALYVLFQFPLQPHCQFLYPFLPVCK